MVGGGVGEMACAVDLGGEDPGEGRRVLLPQQLVLDGSGAVHDAVESAVTRAYVMDDSAYGIEVGDVRRVIAHGSGRAGEGGERAADLAGGEDAGRGRLDLRGGAQALPDEGRAQGDPVMGVGDGRVLGVVGRWRAADEFDVAAGGFGEGDGRTGGDAAGAAGQQHHRVAPDRERGRRFADGRGGRRRCAGCCACRWCTRWPRARQRRTVRRPDGRRSARGGPWGRRPRHAPRWRGVRSPRHGRSRETCAGDRVGRTRRCL